MNTKQKGSIALSRAITYFIRQNYSVFLPLSDNGGDIDVIITKDGENVIRIQCKYTERYKIIKNKKVWLIDLRVRNGKRNTSYRKNSFDKLFVSTPKKDYIFDWGELIERYKNKIPKTLLINEGKNKNYALL
jgi:hypothetical protein